MQLTKPRNLALIFTQALSWRQDTESHSDPDPVLALSSIFSPGSQEDTPRAAQPSMKAEEATG